MEKNMDIVALVPKKPATHVFDMTFIPRLGIPQLLTIAQVLGHDCMIYEEELGPVDWTRVAGADLVLISSTTSTAPRAYWLVEKIREVNKKAPILMGGPHCTFLPEEALEHGVDFVFRHEADLSFPTFLTWYQSTRDPQQLLSISGLSFYVGSHPHHNPRPPRVDLDTLPTPNLDLIYGFSKPSVISIITSRGCPYNCDFCSEINMFGREYRFRSDQKVLEDIKYYQDRYGKLNIFFADDNFAANPIRLRKLCQAMIDHKLVRSWSAQVRLDLAERPEDIKLMRQAGCERVYIGYESTNDESLAAMGKKLVYEDMKRYTKVFHNEGIMIHSMWVLGFDTDDLATVKKTVRTSIHLGIETTQFLILVPIPGSALFERFQEEGRIFCHDWAKFDGHHVVFTPKKMSARQLQIAVMLDAMPKFYNIWQTQIIFLQNNWRTFMAMFKSRQWHPWRDTRRNFLTMAARIWGRHNIRKNKKSTKKYLEEIPR